ncbi:hypothetical protein EmuJ_001173300 [Echinococcus multilocularis]|uniref:Uncharacterized protein n=1 Tax=Echinococcus multilocularis TaxID=6211 RepID=A0A068XY67_ECHMU|nr:hypothetical protein EmuJ_001173300 [Echinococcus multilocularis]
MYDNANAAESFLASADSQVVEVLLPNHSQRSWSKRKQGDLYCHWHCKGPRLEVDINVVSFHLNKIPYHHFLQPHPMVYSFPLATAAATLVVPIPRPKEETSEMSTRRQLQRHLHQRTTVGEIWRHR